MGRARQFRRTGAILRLAVHLSFRIANTSFGAESLETCGAPSLCKVEAVHGRASPQPPHSIFKLHFKRARSAAFPTCFVDIHRCYARENDS